VASFDDGDDWFEISEDLWRDPRARPKKLKLCADASVPQQFVDEVRQANIPVRIASEDGLSNRPDAEILAWANRAGRVLITFDQDFWDDRKFPLQNVKGLIFVDASPSKIDDALMAFGLVYGPFASSYSLEWWEGMKVRAKREGFILKMRTWEGKMTQYAIKLVGGRLYARELSSQRTDWESIDV